MKLLATSLKAFLRRHERSLVIVLGALLLTGFLMNLEFGWMESTLYDFRMRAGTQSSIAPDIALIAIDDATLTKLDELSPIPLDQHVKLLESLEAMNPRSIGYLVDMNRVAQAHGDQVRGSTGERFVEIASRLGSKGIPFLFGTPFDINGEVVPPYPLSTLPHAVSVIHKDGNVFGEDKITRRALLTLYGKPAFHLELAHLLSRRSLDEPIRGQFSDPSIEASYFFFRYQGANEFGQRAEKKTDYPIYSMIDVLEGRVEREKLAGKTVLVGSMSRTNSDDYALTPYSKRPFSNPKLVVHAHILNSVLSNKGIVRSPDWFNWVSTFLVTSFVIWSVFTYTPLYGVFNTLLLAAGFLFVGQLLFSVRGLWIREAQPLVGIFLSYYLAVPYRLILEYKRRWEYQRKNEILVQVEEMKTNFLRLVTHDLKTPVARIQGLAEMVLRQSAPFLGESGTENLRHITRSTEELNRFISSILELTQIESNRITLNLETKDVNQIVERLVDHFGPQSRAASIRITTDLEPLFPIRLDASLITKVLTNVVDNALKYSPENSEVRIETRDLGDQIEIKIKDQGIGLSEDELKNLFTRFYRAKNDQTTRISGTGLGLYLTKYFVEAHRGRVEVSSEKGQGSEFRIILPADLRESDLIQPGLVSSEKGVNHVSRTRSG